MVSWTSSSGVVLDVLLSRVGGRLVVEPRRREVEPPTVVKSGKSEGQATTWTSRLRLDDGFDMVVAETGATSYDATKRG